MAEERSADQNPKPVSSPESAKTIMKIGLLVGIALIVAGGLLLFLNLTVSVTPAFVSARGEYSGLVQGGVLMIVGIVMTIIMAIGLTGQPHE